MFKQKSDFRSTLKGIADEYKIPCRIGTEKVVLRDNLAPIALIFESIPQTSSDIFAYMYVRTTSWEFDGERTDLHEYLAILLAVYLRIEENISSTIIDVPNPVADIPGEIYARYIIPTQPQNATYSLSEDGIKKIKQLVICVQGFKYALQLLAQLSYDEHDSAKMLNPNYSREQSLLWSKRIAELVGDNWAIKKDIDSIPDDLDQLIKSVWEDKVVINEGIQSCIRNNPTWKHYRSIDSKLTIFEAKWFPSAFLKLISMKKLFKKVEGISSSLYVSNGTVNSVSFKTQKRVNEIISSISPIGKDSSHFSIPLENFLVSFTKSHMIITESGCGKKEFEIEREKVRERHIEESKLLFPLINFTWKKNISPGVFENLILDLLKREPGVKRARIVSPTKERDGGRDIICDWNGPAIAGDQVEEGKAPNVSRRIIVQCKTSNVSVGKSKVLDIRDTIEHYEGGGYLLVVSSLLSNTLTSHLDKLRHRGAFWVDWWTRSEIEDRLSKHQDIALKYKNIVQFEEPR